MPRDRERAIVIAGGGTGGHVFPGLAVARELRARRAARPVRWVGARGGFEERLVPRDGFEITLLPLGGMVGLGALRQVRSAVQAAGATLRLLARFAADRPALLIGVGGFASGPAVLAAAALGVPALLLEQNAVPGATNRWLSRLARAVAASFPESARGLSGRVVVTGNPVRDEVSAIRPRDGGPVANVLAFGGSRGARSLNDAWIGALPLLRDVPAAFVLQTGDGDAERVAAAARACGARAEVLAFLDDMPARLASADLVVARAGATTVAELTAAGRAAILVPFPHAANDHQRANARALAARGAACYVDPDELTPERLAREVRALAGDPARVQEMGTAARALGARDATRRVADLAEELQR